MNIFIWGPSVTDQSARQGARLSVVTERQGQSGQFRHSLIRRLSPALLVYMCIVGDAPDDIFLLDLSRLEASGSYQRLVSVLFRLFTFCWH